MYRRKNILITGAAGFIGYHLTKHFVDNPNYFVIAIDDLSRGKLDKYMKELRHKTNITFYELDINNNDFSETMDFIVKDHNINYFDNIYHMAAINGTKNFYKRPVDVLDVNINTCLNLLKWTSKDNCKSIVFASSCEAYYGTINRFSKYEEMLPTNEEIPLTIDHIYNPRASYAISKIVGESLFINMCASENIKFNILRYHNVYGERMGDCHIVPEVTERIKNARCEIDIYGGEQTRSFMYIEDCVRDTIKVCESDFSGEIFNIGCEKEVLIRDVVNKLIHFSGKELKVNNNNAPVGSVQRRLPDMKKFNKYFGLSKNTPFYTGLLKTYNWYIANS